MVPPTEICALVVTHEPDAAVAAHVTALRPQVARMILVDNGSRGEGLDRVRALSAGTDLELIGNADNLGIATALNQGAARARALGFAWLATFDQDSHATAGFVDALREAWARFPDRDRVAIVAPLYRDRHLGTMSSPSESLRRGRGEDKAVSVTATSGNLLRLDAWHEIGGFRDDLFVDCVDFEFCLRARHHGWLVLEARGVELEHAQGRAERRYWFGRHSVVNDYGPERRYYQARNRLIMYARHGTVDPRWIARDAVGYVSDVTKMLLFTRQRGPKLRAVIEGFWHALAGRRGGYRPRGERRA